MGKKPNKGANAGQAKKVTKSNSSTQAKSESGIPLEGESVALEAGVKPSRVHSKPRSVWVLVLLFGSPILLFTGLVALIYVPRLLASPKYDFVYSTCQTYRCNNYKFDDSGKIIETKKSGVNIVVPDGGDYQMEYLDQDAVAVDDTATNYTSAPYPKLYVYKQSDDSTSEINVDEYNTLKLNRNKISSDGYKLERTNFGGSVIVGYSSNVKTWSRKKGIASKPVSLNNNESHYYSDSDVKFLGWIEDVK